MTSLVQQFKQAVSRSLPEGARRWIWYVTDPRYRAESQAQRQRDASRRLVHAAALPKLREQTGGRVMQGPFAGMRYLESWHSGNASQRLLGTYEKELAPIIETIAACSYDTVIDIGAADGYYVTGLAMRLPQARVVAFELDERMHPILRQQAEVNQVGARVEVHGICAEESLRKALEHAGATLIICDVEGAEYHLLKPSQVPALAQADILVEVHSTYPGPDGDVPCPEMAQVLESRFTATHQIERIASRPRTLADLPASVQLAPELALPVMDEFRGSEMSWLWMRRKSS